MPLPVRLPDVVDEMEAGGDEWTAYINRKTGELAAFPHDLERMLEEEDAEAASGLPDWQAAQLEDCRRVINDQDFIALPSKFDVHEWAIMERFCRSLDDGETQNRLLDAIRGRGAFRMFKAEVSRLGIREDWFRYRNDALKRIAADFLQDKGIPYVDEARGAASPAQTD